MAKVDMTGVPAELLSESGRYKPGHDAKHVSMLVAEAKVGGFKVSEVRGLSKQLPTEALREKFLKAVERAKAPKVSKPRAARADTPEGEADAEAAQAEAFEAKAPANPDDVIRYVELPDIKKGRWHFPAREAHTESGVIVERNTARDGSGDWVAV